ncbi:MAG: conjugal transfer protein TraO [Nitrosomonadales bacterium]|nr:conjugal transfer protein TraO [Nitrosomonadales bacterium]
MTVQAEVGRQSKVVVLFIVVTVVLVGYIAWTYVADSARKPTQNYRGISAVKNGRGTPTSESDHYRDVLNRYNQKNADSAKQTGDSYLSVLSSRTKDVPEEPVVEPKIQQQQQPPRSPKPDPRAAKLLEEQTQALLANWKSVPHEAARETASNNFAQSLAPPPADPNAKSTTAAAVNQKIVEDFALVPALLETDIDTDENSVVIASIPTGDYAGAKVYAMGYKRLNNSVDMTFTYMKWQGRSYTITAKPVDQTTMRTALSGEVNTRWFSRIIIPAFAKGIGRTGQLYEQANAQNIITPEGGVIQTHPSTPSGSAVAGTIVGGIGTHAGEVLANDAANMPIKQVLIPKRTTIGIQFIGPVLTSNDVAAAARAPNQPPTDLNALSEPASQPPRQNAPTAPTYGGTYAPPGAPTNNVYPRN